MNKNMCLRCGKDMEEGQELGKYLGTTMHSWCIDDIKASTTSVDNKPDIPPRKEPKRPLKTPRPAPTAEAPEPRGTVKVDSISWRTLSDQQMTNIEIYSTYLYEAEWAINPQNIYDNWNQDPQHMNKSGPRPKLELIASYMGSKQYKGNMEKWGITDFNSLTTDQLVAIKLITDTADKRTLRTKLKSIGVDTKTYQQWTRNPAFASHIKRLTDHSLQFAVEMGKIALSQKVEEGDLASIKYLNELTGFFNPNDTAKTAENLQSLMQIVLEEVQNVVADPNTLSEIQTRIAMRSNALRAGAVPTNSSPMTNSGRQLN